MLSVVLISSSRRISCNNLGIDLYSFITFHTLITQCNIGDLILVPSAVVLISSSRSGANCDCLTSPSLRMRQSYYSNNVKHPSGAKRGAN